MRLFAAVPVPEPARGQILGLLAQLRATGWPVRWVRDEGLHLTLKFFGEVAPERLEVIEEAMRFAAQGTGELPLQLDELGSFPGGSRPRVLWIGFATPPALELLQDRLERGCEATRKATTSQLAREVRAVCASVGGSHFPKMASAAAGSALSQLK